MKLVLYARVSTDEQTCENQIKELMKLADAQGNTVFHVYQDVMSGGASNRPGFQEMMYHASLRRFDAVLVWSLDRFSREGISNTLSYLKRLKKYGVGVRSLQEPWLNTSDDGMGELLIAILSWVAGMERKRISERTKAGLARSSKKPGRPVGSRDRKPRSKLNYLKRWSK